MADALYQQILAAHRRTLDRLIERGAVERLRAVYTKASAEVLTKLEKLGKGSATFTAQHLRMSLAQLRAGQIYVDDQLLGELNAASREAQIESLHGLIRSYKRLETKFTGQEPVLPIEDAARFAGVLDKGRASLLRQHAVSIKRYGMQSIEQMQDAMSLSLAGGETLDGTISRVHNVIKSDFWRAERIARTECSWAAHAAHSDGIKEIAKEDAGGLPRVGPFAAADVCFLLRGPCYGLALGGEREADLPAVDA